jgi:hypothetical protein
MTIAVGPGAPTAPAYCKADVRAAAPRGTRNKTSPSLIYSTEDKFNRATKQEK